METSLPETLDGEKMQVSQSPFFAVTSSIEYKRAAQTAGILVPQAAMSEGLFARELAPGVRWQVLVRTRLTEQP